MDEKYLIVDNRTVESFKQKIFSGFKKSDVINIVLKSIESNKLENACFWTTECIISGYANIHLLPIFQKKIAYGSKGFPWSSDICKREIDYNKGICPVAEELNDKTFLGYEMCLHNLNEKDTNLIIDAFKKVWNNLDERR